MSFPAQRGTSSPRKLSTSSPASHPNSKLRSAVTTTQGDDLLNKNKIKSSLASTTSALKTLFGRLGTKASTEPTHTPSSSSSSSMTSSSGYRTTNSNGPRSYSKSNSVTPHPSQTADGSSSTRTQSAVKGKLATALGSARTPLMSARGTSSKTTTAVPGATIKPSPVTLPRLSRLPTQTLAATVTIGSSLRERSPSRPTSSLLPGTSLGNHENPSSFLTRSRVKDSGIKPPTFEIPRLALEESSLGGTGYTFQDAERA